MSKPFCSIIIPTLNEEEYLPRLLRCLIRQTDPSFEIIIVDGASDDATVVRARAFDSRFKKRHIAFTVLTVLKRNVSYQRNYGAARARGTYIVFLDADVQIGADYIQTLNVSLQDSHIPYATTWVDADSSDPRDKAIAVLCNTIYEIARVLEIDFVPGYNCIIRQDIFKKIHGFSSRVVMEEDYHLAQKLKKKGYTITLLKHPKLVISLRRYRNEGHLSVIRKHVHATAHFLFRGPITKELFHYPMGGGAFVKQPLTTADRKRYQHYLEMTKNRLKQYMRDVEIMIKNANF